MDIEDILIKWNFSNLIPLFKENKITLLAFKQLDYYGIADLIKDFSTRSLFWKKYKLEKYNLDADCICSSSLKSDPTNFNLGQLENDIVNNDDEPKINQTTSSPSQIAKYLDCADGNLINLYYKKFESLDCTYRNILAKVFIHGEFQYQKYPQNFKITTDRFLQLREEIVRIFPKEKEFQTIYFFPYDKQINKHSSGKLWDTYNHFKSKLNKLKPEKERILTQLKIPGNIKEKLEYLISNSNISDYYQIQECWKKTFEHRNSLLKHDDDVVGYFKKFPILNTIKGSKLLIKDFEFLYPKHSNKLFSCWESINKKLVQIGLTKISNLKTQPSTSFLSESKKNISEIINLKCTFRGLLLLPHLLNKSSYTKGAKRKKLTTVEIENSFINLISDANLINESTMNQQPTIFMVGDSYDSIRKFFVTVNNTIYEFENTLTTLDGCFKIFQVLHYDYPAETKPIWTFIQKYIYEINTKYDKNYTSVTSLFSELTKMELSN